MIHLIVRNIQLQMTWIELSVMVCLFSIKGDYKTLSDFWAKNGIYVYIGLHRGKVPLINGVGINSTIFAAPTVKGGAIYWHLTSMQ